MSSYRLDLSVVGFFDEVLTDWFSRKGAEVLADSGDFPSNASDSLQYQDFFFLERGIHPKLKIPQEDNYRQIC
jgi:hypothetical protein